MPWGLKRFQEARCLHFLTFSWGLAHLCTTTAEAAPPFAIFEGACPEPSRRVGISDDGIGGFPERRLRPLELVDEPARIEVRGAHLSKSAKGGAASFVRCRRAPAPGFFRHGLSRALPSQSQNQSQKRRTGVSDPHGQNQDQRRRAGVFVQQLVPFGLAQGRVSPGFQPDSSPSWSA
jgi:hypothetical protein